MIKSFNPIYRLSNSALQHLDTAFQNGWGGHHEVSIPSVLHHLGLKIQDFGGVGSFVPRGCKYRFYNSESMWFKPLSAGDRKNYLYHPVKESSSSQ